MGGAGTKRAAQVAAAQAGDDEALGGLVAAYLPLVYSIVRRALAGHPAAVDDVVQDTMLRALRQLPSLRAPDSFRAWIAAIAVRQAATYLHGERVTAGRRAPLDDVANAPDAGDFEDLTMLRLELAVQRRQAGQAVAWLDPDDRMLWSLWWLEVGEELTRAEVAAALGVSVAHAGVRVQRMRRRLEQARVLVAALDARPRCPWLTTVVAGWDGIPGPLWRKRIARHTRSCATCADGAEEMVDTEQLLSGFALLPVPAGLVAAVVGHGPLSAPPAAGGWLAGVPVAKVMVAVTVVAGVGVAAETWPGGATRPSAAPSAEVQVSDPGPVLRAGPVSLESTAVPGRYVGTDGPLGTLVTAGGPAARSRATFEAVPGLSNAVCYSFRAADGQFLRHQSWRLRVSRDDGTFVFRGDATFCPLAGGAGRVLLESANYRGYFIHRQGDELWVDQADGSAAFQVDSEFRVRPPLS